MSSEGEILVVPAFGQGHLFPAMELCKLLSARNYESTLVLFPHHSSSVPSSFRHHPLLHVVDVPTPPPSDQGSDFRSQHQSSLHQMILALDHLFSTRPHKPICAIVDTLMILGFTAEVFRKFEVPTVGFFTSGACSAALEFAAWKAHPGEIKPGEVVPLPGLPDDMGLTVSDLKRRPQGPPGGGGGGPIGGGKKKGMGLPGPGEPPSWVDDAEKSIALVINTCDDLERPFLRYLADQIGKPVWGVGPLVSEQYWKSAGSVVRDRESRPNKQSSVTEDEVIQWLDSKPRGSVLYVAFGSSVVPTAEEHAQLAEALGESTWPFIWVIQPGSGKSGNSRALFGSKTGPDSEEDEKYFSNDQDSRVGDRGLIIRGWAPQLLILSHPSTGGFLSHCGWNSTMEAIGLGVPLLAWPLRGDQYYDAKLVVSHLKVGYIVKDDMSEMVKKEEIVKGIDRLMGDEEVKKTAAELKSKFVHGFPETSTASLDAFCNFVKRAA